MKPATCVLGTWDEPRQAATWLGERLTELAPRFDPDARPHTASLDLLVSSAADRLQWGGDVSLGFYLQRPSFLSLALVTCSPNRAVPELGCPVG